MAVLERTRFDWPRIGETPTPAVQPLLPDLGVWDRFAALGRLPSWGTRSIWHGPEPAEHTHLTSGYGSGWHVDRRAVDRMLGDAAADVGCARYDGTAWDVDCTDGQQLRGRVLVDETGRKARLSRSLGSRSPRDGTA